MGWESPLDRMLIRQVDAVSRGREKPEDTRDLIMDLIETAPERVKSFFHLGYARACLDPELFDTEVSPEDTGPFQWSLFGRLMGAYRRRNHALVSKMIREEGGVELVDDPLKARATSQVILKTGFDDGDRDLVMQALERLNADQNDILEEAILEILRRVERPHDPSEEEAHKDLLVRCLELKGFEDLPPNIKAPLHRDIGRIYQHAGQWDEAIGEFEKCVEIAGGGHTLASVLHFDLAACYLEVRGVPDLVPTPGRTDTEKALGHLNEATEDPKFASFNAYFARGVLQLESDKFEEARDDFEQALERIQSYRNPLPVTLARIRYYLGLCLIASKEAELEGRAVSLIEQALERVEPEPAFFEVIHEVLKKRSRRTALRHLDAVDRTKLGDSESRFEARSLAQEFMTLGEPGRARRVLEESLRTETDADARIESLTLALKATALLGDKDCIRDAYYELRELLIQKGRYTDLESLLKGESSEGIALDHLTVLTELADLYQSMEDRLDERVGILLDLARISQKRRTPEALAIAADFVREAHELDQARASEDLALIEEKIPDQLPEWMDDEPIEDVVHDCQDVLERDPKILVVGGHESLRPQVALLDDLANQFGIEAQWWLANYTSPDTVIEKVQEAVRSGATDALILLHGNRQETIRRARDLARSQRIPFRVIRYFTFSSLRMAVGNILDKVVDFNAPLEDDMGDGESETEGAQKQPAQFESEA